MKIKFWAVVMLIAPLVPLLSLKSVLLPNIPIGIVKRLGIRRAIEVQRTQKVDFFDFLPYDMADHASSNLKDRYSLLPNAPRGLHPAYITHYPIAHRITIPKENIPACLNAFSTLADVPNMSAFATIPTPDVAMRLQNNNQILTVVTSGVSLQIFESAPSKPEEMKKIYDDAGDQDPSPRFARLRNFIRAQINQQVK